MSITGGIKFFDKNLALSKDGATIVTTSGQAGAGGAIDNSRSTKWVSVGTDDTTTETITVTLSASITIDRLLFTGINWKQFQVKYWNGSSFTDFSNVVGLDASSALISETTFADDTAYYEFDSVSTTIIQVTVDKTQTVDAEKELVSFIATSELGTFESFPIVQNVTNDRNKRTKISLSGKAIVQPSFESSRVSIQFKQHPSSNDIGLAEMLHLRENPFLVWLSGGRRGTTYFKTTTRGWRLQDAINVHVVSPLSPQYGQNVYINGVNMRMDLAEATV